MNKALPDDFKLQRKYVFQMVKTKNYQTEIRKSNNFQMVGTKFT